ncbi:hypothetical protein [Catenuloplanes indicus]|uniref:Uncharacterized protein n=1 Tax=Catenuloplanes indicus TaxID=137267 RepID=A0AAE3WAE3_9ACTN|nr:hypothetical protein [Catenuloplanes indicus]MDQ0371579.1 hypothetical protein [Catenuloplanes indicus]
MTKPYEFLDCCDKTRACVNAPAAKPFRMSVAPDLQCEGRWSVVADYRCPQGHTWYTSWGADTEMLTGSPDEEYTADETWDPRMMACAGWLEADFFVQHGWELRTAPDGTRLARHPDRPGLILPIPPACGHDDCPTRHRVPEIERVLVSPGVLPW